MTETTNLKLKKPGYDDSADIGVVNGNMDTLDGEITGVKATAERAASDAEGAMKQTGGTLTGALVAGGAQDLATPQVRNVTISNADPVGGVNGQLHFKYSE